ncbi:MAG: DUF4113 domain-containing protein [Plesiomonas sp.]
MAKFTVLLQREHLSPRYTTSLVDILVVS